MALPRNQNFTLRSNADIGDVDPYLRTDKIMRFIVGNTFFGYKQQWRIAS